MSDHPKWQLARFTQDAAERIRGKLVWVRAEKPRSPAFSRKPWGWKRTRRSYWTNVLNPEGGSMVDDVRVGAYLSINAAIVELLPEFADAVDDVTELTWRSRRDVDAARDDARHAA